MIACSLQNTLEVDTELGKYQGFYNQNLGLVGIGDFGREVPVEND
jgi:hypothetical protein